MEKKKVAIIGVTGSVGQEFVQSLLPGITHAVAIGVITPDYLQVRTPRCKPQGRIAIFMSFAPRPNCSHQLTWGRRGCKDSPHCGPIVRIPTNMDPVLEGKTRMQFVPPLLTNLHMRKRQIHYKRETPISPESFPTTSPKNNILILKFLFQ